MRLLTLAVVVSIAASIVFGRDCAVSSPPNGWEAFPAYAVNVEAGKAVSIPEAVCPVSAISDADARSKRTGHRVLRVVVRDRVVRNRAGVPVRVYVFCG